ncbi:MAG TPA: DUF1684 domain-containing protein [Bryobacteraceae bacterium]|nr:DUF1684 domain-containing protein [Bryobacteraceae bacterium]
MTRLLALLLAGVAMAAVAGYQASIEDWRRQRVAALQADGGWLTVTGLFWLHSGSNRFGSNQANEIVLPDGPPSAGLFELRDGSVTVKMEGQTRVLKPDSEDAARVGRLSLFVLKRGDRYAIRMKDPESEFRKKFQGIRFFPPDETYRVTARWVARPRQLPIANILGQTEPSDNPGYAEFELQGKQMRLYPIIEEPGDQQLFYIFRDLTTGKETYPAGRFFYSDMPKDGRVVLDFNKAYNPPCAFTPYATCPLPPKENHLPIRVEAGEKTYHLNP